MRRLVLLLIGMRTVYSGARVCQLHDYLTLLRIFRSLSRELSSSSLDPFFRPLIWDRWGFSKLQFPYLQPALDADKEPVRNLLLMAKTFHPSYAKGIPSAVVAEAVFDYVRWAMRIENPEDNPEYRNMKAVLAGVDIVGLLPLKEYAAPTTVVVKEVTRETPDDLESVIKVYESSYSSGPVAFSSEEFRRNVQLSKHLNKPYRNHLWSIRIAPSEPIAGMASFFAFPGIGFGGYLVLVPPLQGTGRLNSILRTMERAMVQDGIAGSGWLIECEAGEPAFEIFKSRGFFEIEIEYRQPPLESSRLFDSVSAPGLHLLYKEFGEQFTPPELTVQSLRSGMEWVLDVIYKATPETKEVFNRQVWPTLASHLDNVTFRL